MSNCLSISFLVISFLAIVSSQQQPGNHVQPSQYYPQSRAQPQPHQSQLRQQYQQPQRSQFRAPQPQPQQQPQSVRYVYPSSNVPTQPAQSPSSYISGHHKIIDPSNNQVIYHHYYNTDNNSHHEVRHWYNPEGQAAKPIVERALAGHYQAPINNLPHQSQPAPINYQPHVARQQFNQQTAVAPQDYRRSLDKSNEYSSPVISRQSVPSWLNNIETLVSYIKSSTFLNQVNTLGSQLAFRDHVVGEHKKEDEKFTRSNIENTNLNFSLNQEDCKPKLTTIKLGNPDQPEIVYNPATVEVLRCPQACFSWQFDCLPTQEATNNFTVAAYFTSGDKTVRNVDQYTISSHLACACSCQSLAGCFGNTKFSAQRLPPSPLR